MSLDAEDIRNEKVKVLRSMRALSMEDVVVGQYRGRKTKAAKLPGYLDDKTVPSGRRAAAARRRVGCLVAESAVCCVSMHWRCDALAGAGAVYSLMHSHALKPCSSDIMRRCAHTHATSRDWPFTHTHSSFTAAEPQGLACRRQC